MKRIIVALLVAAFLLTLVSCRGAEDFRGYGMNWTIGFGKCELIPENIDSTTYYMAGYKNDNPVTGVLDYQYARALWLDDNSYRGAILLIAVDCIGLSSIDVDLIRASLREYNCRAIHVFATHTHAGIDTIGLWGPVAADGKSESFQQIVYNAIKQAAKDAYADRKNGNLYCGTVEVENLQRDSRAPYVFSKTLTSIRFEPSDGSTGVRLINFAAHPEATGSDNSLISADYPCYMGRKIKEVSGDEFIYITGAIGGLITTSLDTDKVIMGETFSTPNMDAVIIGERLADYTLGIDNERQLSPSLNIISRTFDIPLDNQVYIAMTFLGVISTKVVTGDSQYGLAIRTEVTYMELGNFKALFVPGELFPELAYGYVDFEKKANSTVHTPEPLYKLIGNTDSMDITIFGLCDDEIGYIIPPDDFYLNEDLPYIEKGVDRHGRKHYEETNSVGRDAAECLAKAVNEMMKKIRS